METPGSSGKLETCAQALMNQIESLIFLLGVAALLAQLARVLNVP